MASAADKPCVAAPLSGRCRAVGSKLIWASLACTVVTVALFVWWGIGDHVIADVPCHHLSNNVVEHGLAALRVLITAPLGLWLSWVASSPHMRCAASFILLNWAAALVAMVKYLGHCRLSFYRPSVFEVVTAENNTVETTSVGEWAILVNIPLAVFVVIANYDLAISRVEAVEDNALRSFGIELLRPIMRLEAGLGFLLTVPYFLVIQLHTPDAINALWALAGIGTILWIVASLILYRALFRVVISVYKATKRAPEWISVRAHQSHMALRVEVLCLSLSIFSSGAFTFYQLVFISEKEGEYLLAQRVLGIADTLFNCLLGLLLSGALSGAVQGTTRRAVLARERLKTRRRAVRKWRGQPRRSLEEFQGWEQKVQELAGRGISLGALLKFYRELPTIMEGFDSSQHTTGSVVSRAIIPLTMKQQCAASEILMGGVVTFPDKMVTHAWCNLFRDLVAAVLADALGEGEYVFFSRLLDSDSARVEHWVQIANVGQRTYWICAFAVNQHLALCETNDSRTDPVTGQRCPKCACGLTKAYNSTPPFLPDGRSVPCEMNKFDDMMRFLAAKNPHYSQVVPIDAKFQTFTRAWCIAELAAASELGMVQDIKIGSAPELSEHGESLRHLRIQDMHASREEDKVSILASIENHEAFNVAMQRLIFEDLLPKWNSMDAQERMASAGRIIRWQDTDVWKDPG